MRRFRSLIACTLSFCLAASATGQEAVRDFSLAVERNPLLTFDNAAGLATLGKEHFSEATGSFSTAVCRTRISGARRWADRS